VRAPNISELFQPQGQTFALFTDPCDQSRLDQGSSTRRANCATILTGLNPAIDPATFNDPNSASVAGLLRGNRGLLEETAETKTLGAVFRPRFIEGLTFSIDFYQIEIADAINIASAEELSQLCVDAPTTTNQFCGFITRDPTTGGIVNFQLQPFNVAEFITRGYDFSANYLLDPQRFGLTQDIGTFNFRVVGNKLTELSFISVPGADRDFDEGEGGALVGAPEWQAALDITWEKGPWTVNYGFNYFDETQRYTTEQIRGEPDIADPKYFNYEAKTTHDVQVRYTLGERWSVYAGVNNLSDQQPDIGEVAYPVNPIGRFWYAGVRTSLPSLGSLVGR
jgi:outer membrane receptor protein involved in Fe transport